MRLLYIGEKDDSKFTFTLKDLLAGNPCTVYCGDVLTKAELLNPAKRAGVSAILTSNTKLVKLLTGNPKATVDKYAGSLLKEDGLEVLVIPPLEQQLTTSTGKHLMARYISKLLKKDAWFHQTAFTWEIATEETVGALLARFSTAKYMAVDIETRKDNLQITCTGYCAVWLGSDGKYTTHSIVLPMDNDFWVAQCSLFNALPVPKIMQNGQYDASYFIRYGIPPTNYIFDTLNLFHCWYSEFPKSLDFISSYCLRDFQYWKDESAEAANQVEYFRYNAKDTWVTANCFLALMLEMPAWARANYLTEFPLIFPCLHAALEGIAIDSKERDRLTVVETAKLDNSLAELRASLGSPKFNPSSPVQVKKLLLVLGVPAKDATSSDAKTLVKASVANPFAAWFLGRIVRYREARKLLSSYLEATLLNGRYMYSLSPSGTDTGRLASRESSFWCGGNIQNTPAEVKSMYVADKGWLMAEVDYSQSEARCVAYLSGDMNLITVVEGSRDYHAVNAEMFFGVPYAEVVEAEAVRKRDKTTTFTIRDLSKRVNHGANYNMGAGVLLDTMGVENVQRAKKLLKLPANWSLKQVCEHLLACYDKAYPQVKSRWYDSIKYSILTTSMLRSALGWTRYCFGKPSNSKQALNSYVAHVPQNLSVSIINKAFMLVWQQLALTGRIRLKAQIHDSLLFQYREGDEEVVAIVAKLLEIPTSVTGSDNITRTMLIPNDVKLGLTRWREL